jgi:hypothetical protein
VLWLKRLVPCKRSLTRYFSLYCLRKWCQVKVITMKPQNQICPVLYNYNL